MYNIAFISPSAKELLWKKVFVHQTFEFSQNIFTEFNEFIENVIRV